MPILAKETNKQTENMTPYETWTTEDLIKTQKDYIGRMKDYNRRELKKSATFKFLKFSSQLIDDELNKRK